MNELNVKAGDEVIYYCNGYGSKQITKVTKVTPTGRIRVACNPTIQFDKHGNEMGKTDPFHACYIKECTTEMKERIVKEQTIRKCIHEFEEKKSELTFEQAVDILQIIRNGGKKE